jgi:hypothetical protein
MLILIFLSNHSHHCPQAASVTNVLRRPLSKKPDRTLYAPQCFQISRTVNPNCFCLHCATIAFAYTNIPYLAVKVNILYRSLIFFEHHVHFQHLFFVNYNTNHTINIKKLQNGKSKITPITQRTSLHFILID